MRIRNVSGRATVVIEGHGVDVATASAGRFAADPHDLLEHWDEFREWASGLEVDGAAPLTSEPCGPPVPRPRQIFAIGMNYRDHATEIGFEYPTVPSTFTKFPTAITGPDVDVVLPAGNVDWEAELVVVIGRAAHRVAREDAWSYVAGVTVGQDLSERRLQLSGPAPQQFSLAKSFPGFAPLGPELVTVDELDDPDDLVVGCELNGEEVQRARSSDMIFPVPELIARLSAVVTLLPGDLIFTGTPPGVGLGRTPPRFLSPDDELVSYVEGVGEIRTRLTSAGDA